MRCNRCGKRMDGESASPASSPTLSEPMGADDGSDAWAACHDCDLDYDPRTGVWSRDSIGINDIDGFCADESNFDGSGAESKKVVAAVEAAKERM